MKLLIVLVIAFFVTPVFAGKCAPGLVNQGFVCNDDGEFLNLDPNDFQGPAGNPEESEVFREVQRDTQRNTDRIERQESRFGSRIDDVEEQGRVNRAGIAMSNAIGAQQFDLNYTGLQMSISGGYFDGQSAGALGLGGKINDRLFINAHAATGRNKWSGGVSVTIR